MMRKQYHVSGQYLARYPNGHHTGMIGISAQVRAKNKRAAKKAVSQEAIKTHGYVRFNWLDVDASQVQ
ncbi:MAG: hypothetical protein GY803_28005 [Chloroflexi bacterium]|nr:hypothetical protein [Chloroflexota bacterium]